MERRRFITALGTASTVVLAGCIGGDDDPENGAANGIDDSIENGADNSSGNGTGNDATPTEGGPDNGGDASGNLGDPQVVVESFLTAAADHDIEAAADLLHPSHPFHPDNLDEDMEFERALGDVTASTVETELVTKDVAVETVVERVAGAEFFFEEAQLADALEEGQSALVEATATGGDQPLEYLSVVTSHDGEWRILWQGKVTDTTEPAPEFDTRVVDGIRFDTDEDRVRIQFVEYPVADEVTVESANTDTYASTDTTDTTDYLSVGLDPTGDEFVVTAINDGESRVVHREHYPPTDRVVDDITFDTDPENSPFDGTARVEFNDIESDGELVATSTRAGGESSIEPAGSATFLVVDIDPDGDEVIVTLTEDGETEEIHRERHHP